MSLLRDLIIISEGSKLDELPEDVMKEVQKNIRAGAKDLQQNWANALELTHKAYEVAGVQRPTPDMRNAWKQYEQNLTFAVEQLSKYRGIDGSWRMSAKVFHESLQQTLKFRVHLSDPRASVNYVTEARSIDELIDTLTVDHGEDGVEIKKSNPQEGQVTLRFYKYNVNTKFRVDIEQIGRYKL